jgi:hypothetical protein
MKFLVGLIGIALVFAVVAWGLSVFWQGFLCRAPF